MHISEQLFRISCLEGEKLEDAEVKEARGVNITLQFFPQLFTEKCCLPQDQAGMGVR